MEKHQEEESISGETTAMATNKPYPPAEVEYQQLVENSDLFFHKLSLFHSSLGTNFNSTSPCVGGITLDLHRLFMEVTSRGGLDEVIRGRKLEEVISAFKFPTTSIKWSFLLRKYYISLLYHFEQAYFLRKKVPTFGITDTVNQTLETGVQSTTNINEVSTTRNHLAASPKIHPGISLVGNIDEKFDNGYIVSVNVGSELLKGILYHIPDTPQPSWDPSPCISQQRKRKKSRMTLLDPSQPKPMRNSYNFFAEQYSTLKPMSHGQEKSIIQQTGHLWNKLSETEKQFYPDSVARDKEHESREMVENKY